MKRKLNKKLIAVILIILIVISFIIVINSKNVYVGKIKDGKVKYIDRIENVTTTKDKVIIEFKNDEELIDNCIMTNELYDKFKKNDDLYNISVKDYNELRTISAKESYNLNKAVQMKLVSENDKYVDYFAMTCGFKDKNELMKYTKAVLKLAKKVK